MQVGETSIFRLPDTFEKAALVPISGLVVTFNSPVKHHLAAVESLAAFPEVEIGQRGGSKLAIVVDSENKRRDREIWDAVQQLPGVIDVAVAMVAFDEGENAADRTSTRDQG